MQNNHNTHESNELWMLQIHNANAKFDAFKCFASTILECFGSAGCLFVWMSAVCVPVSVPVLLLVLVFVCCRLLHIVLLFHICVRFRISFYDRSFCVLDSLSTRPIQVCWCLWTHANKTQHKRYFLALLLLFEKWKVLFLSYTHQIPKCDFILVAGHFFSLLLVFPPVLNVWYE